MLDDSELIRYTMHAICLPVAVIPLYTSSCPAEKSPKKADLLVERMSYIFQCTRSSYLADNHHMSNSESSSDD